MFSEGSVRLNPAGLTADQVERIRRNAEFPQRFSH